ncbi:mRNA turnover protein 4 homolog [Watersipora subatra]|uniref:mRNA turnover protein 4 homolog n=1 Tax=Watersipora subatra TaxID=2589382 RepID=UPI00355B43BC
MPKSKRDKKISLTRTQKKGIQLKQTLVEEIRDCLDKYARLFTFSTHNMRNVRLKDVRQEWSQSRFFFGKNKVMAVALGRTADEEFKDNLHLVSAELKGQTGLLFTNKTRKEVVKWFNNYRELDYARSGTDVLQTVVLEPGPLKEFSHAMEPQLRKLGLPTTLQRGVVTLSQEYIVCKKGSILTPEQAQILKLFCHPMAEFHFTLGVMWSNDGKLKRIDQEDSTTLEPSVRVAAPDSGPNAIDDEDDDVENDMSE